MKLVRNDFNSWQFVQGDTVIPMDEINVFSSRTDAITTARQIGLKVAGDGSVSIARYQLPDARYDAKRNTVQVLLRLTPAQAAELDTKRHPTETRPAALLRLAGLTTTPAKPRTPA